MRDVSPRLVVEAVTTSAAEAIGEVWGAGLDVFAEEPLPSSSPLWKTPGVILSPHMAGLSPNYDARAMALFSENLHRYVAGERLLNVVDRERGF